MANRRIDLIVVHCSSSDNPSHDDISVIKQWHFDRGFKDVGYHYYIKKSGELQKGRDEGVIGAHVKGHNKYTIGICLGGLDNFKQEQRNTLKELCIDLLKKYNLTKDKIVPHSLLDKHGKTCPNFDVRGVVNSWDL